MYYRLPISWRYFARRMWYAPSDLLDQIKGDRADLCPPKGMIFTGPGDFIKEGQKLLQQFVDYGSLHPNDKVLDIGSGIGRAAVALTTYLTPSAKYLGFDPVKTGVVWCQKKISPKFPNFAFQYIPLKNDLYQKTGSSAANFQFPFEEKHWDFIILTSVFTHMIPEEINQYLQQIRRMLTNEGRVFATFFILSENRKLQNPAYTFPYTKKDYSLMDDEVTSANVAVDKTYLWEMIELNGLQVQATHWGFWDTGIKLNKANFQDVLILTLKD